MSRRRSTVHDAGALRLHPSGVRVNDVVQNSTRSVVTVNTKTPSLSRRLSRGNWIATDAGGDGRVTKRRKIGVVKPTDMEAGKSSTVDGQGEVGGASTQEELEDIPVNVYKDTRANRRVAFKNDLTFLAAPASVPKGNSSHLQPSSDFLKCIHYFASQYYGSRGQLFDSAADYRKVKKENRRQRMLQAAASGSQDPENIQDDENEVEEEQAESDDSSRGILHTESTRGRKGKEKVKPGTSRKTQRDMYKAFDGSALLCIGSLLQSHIASSLVDNMPDSWENDDIADGSEGSCEGTKSDRAGNEQWQEVAILSAQILADGDTRSPKGESYKFIEGRTSLSPSSQITKKRYESNLIGT